MTRKPISIIIGVLLLAGTVEAGSIDAPGAGGYWKMGVSEEEPIRIGPVDGPFDCQIWDDKVNGLQMKGKKCPKPQPSDCEQRMRAAMRAMESGRVEHGDARLQDWVVTNCVP